MERRSRLAPGRVVQFRPAVAGRALRWGHDAPSMPRNHARSREVGKGCGGLRCACTRLSVTKEPGRRACARHPLPRHKCLRHGGPAGPARGDTGTTARSDKFGMIDPFGRRITYLRVSVTDRCDFRCTYCMAEDMTFLPKRDLLTPGRARPAGHRLHRQGRAQAATDRRRAAGAQEHHASGAPAVAASGKRARSTS